VGNGRRVGTIEIALSEVIRDFVERALFPLLGLRQPENPALGIQRGALSAHLFLAAYLHEPVHEPPLPAVKPIYSATLSRIEWRCLSPFRGTNSIVLPHGAVQQCNAAWRTGSVVSREIPSINDAYSSEIRRRSLTDPARNRLHCALHRGARLRNDAGLIIPVRARLRQFLESLPARDAVVLLNSQDWMAPEEIRALWRNACQAK
jgi:hypothetical protein